MRDWVPDEQLLATLWKTNKKYLKTRMVILDTNRDDKVVVAGTRFELPLDLISTTDYDHVMLNLIENEFQSEEDFKLVNNSHALIDLGFRLTFRKGNRMFIKLDYSWYAIQEWIRFIYFLNNEMVQDEKAINAYYDLLMARDNVLSELRTTYHFPDVGMKIRFFAKNRGTLYASFDHNRFTEYIIRLNMLRGAY